MSKYKIGDVVSWDNGSREGVIIAMPDCDDEYICWSELVGHIWMREDELTPCPDKVALAPALITYDGKYKRSVTQYENEAEAKQTYDEWFVKWPAHHTSWVIVKREGK